MRRVSEPVRGRGPYRGVEEFNRILEADSAAYFVENPHWTGKVVKCNAHKLAQMAGKIFTLTKFVASSAHKIDVVNG